MFLIPTNFSRVKNIQDGKSQYPLNTSAKTFDVIPLYHSTYDYPQCYEYLHCTVCHPSCILLPHATKKNGKSLAQGLHFFNPISIECNFQFYCSLQLRINKGYFPAGA